LKRRLSVNFHLPARPVRHFCTKRCRLRKFMCPVSHGTTSIRSITSTATYFAVKKTNVSETGKVSISKTPPLLCHFKTPRSRVLPEKLTVPQLVEKVPAFYATRRFITAFTTARLLSLSSVRSIHSKPHHPTS
jgi:hypothetical protein